MMPSAVLNLNIDGQARENQSVATARDRLARPQVTFAGSLHPHQSHLMPAAHRSGSLCPQSTSYGHRLLNAGCPVPPGLEKCPSHGAHG